MVSKITVWQKTQKKEVVNRKGGKACQERKSGDLTAHGAVSIIQLAAKQPDYITNPLGQIKGKGDLTKMSKLNYPYHAHPHGIDDVAPNEIRVWICDECKHIFSDGEIRDVKRDWGHICKSHPCRKGQRCESHIEPYLPELLD